jgi:hypothetical protein
MTQHLPAGTEDDADDGGDATRVSAAGGSGRRSQSVASYTIAERLGKVDAADGVGTIQIGECSRHLENPMITAG